MSEQNKELWRQFTKVWDVGDTDAFGDFATAGVTDHQAMPGAPAGLDGMKALNTMLRTAFPDRSTEIHYVLGEDDRVAALHTLRGTHTGDFMGMPPTGKSYEVNSVHIVRVADGKVVEHWGMPDFGGMMAQLGLAPMPPGTESWRPPPTSPQVTGAGSGDGAAGRKAMDDMIAAMKTAKIDDVLAGIAEDAVDHAALPGQGPGKDGVRWRFEQLFGGMSDPTFAVTQSVAEGPFLSQAYTFTATHSGPMMGMPPTNKSFHINAIDFIRFENGKMREHWGLLDMPSLMIQLGLMPPPA